MVCIYCGNSTHVTNSRLQKRLNQVWRRRQCLQCGNVFTTHEAVGLERTLMVHHSGGELNAFDKDMLLVSIYESCKHRPSAVADAAGLTHTILAKLYDKLADGVVERDAIVATAIEVLSHFDEAASIIYKAYHPSQTDVAK